MAKNSELDIVHFQVPNCDREGNPYPRGVHKRIQAELEERFGGWSLIGGDPSWGGWVDPATKRRERDASWRYEVGIKPGEIGELDDFLSEVASRLGQKAIWRVLFGEARGRSIPAKARNKD